MLAVRREAAQNVDGRTALSLIPKHSDSLDEGGGRMKARLREISRGGTP
jgi:hypothetical protein